MPPQGQSSGRYYGAGPAHRAQIRQAARVLAKQVQLWRAKVRELEESCERFRDRATLPTPEQVNNALSQRWQAAWDQFKNAERSMMDYLQLFV